MRDIDKNIKPELSITFLGTGGSSGIPEIACKCPVCISDDHKNKRTRTSICIHFKNKNIIIDTTPDFRYQVLENKIDHIDALLYTHHHADHIMGLADVRAFNFKQKKPIITFASSKTIEHIKKPFDFVFNAPEELKKYYPQIDVNIIDGPFKIDDLTFLPFTVFHGRMPVTAFRFENTAYITDVNHLPEEVFELLTGLDLLIIESFQFNRHISHNSLNEAVSAAKKINARQTLFTHISHDFDHETIDKKLPDRINLAYDGLKIIPSEL
ncbi:MBL fold metallo-hydrolase [candidate division KSB1 bacterium]